MKFVLNENIIFKILVISKKHATVYTILKDICDFKILFNLNNDHQILNCLRGVPKIKD